MMMINILVRKSLILVGLSVLKLLMNKPFMFDVSSSESKNLSL
jgi:hypothetical protein